MKKMRRIVASLLLSVAGSVMFASGLSLDSVCRQLADHPNTTGDFIQTKTIKAANRQLKSFGKFVFSLDGIIWDTQKPFPSSLVVGMTSVIQTAADGKKTVIDASGNQIFTSIATTLSSVFSNDLSSLQKNFSTEFTDNGDGGWTLVLFPKDATVSAVMASLSLGGVSSSSGARLDTIVMTEASGNSITYSFSNQKYPEELSADEKSRFTAE